MITQEPWLAPQIEARQNEDAIRFLKVEEPKWKPAQHSSPYIAVYSLVETGRIGQVTLDTRNLI